MDHVGLTDKLCKGTKQTWKWQLTSQPWHPSLGSQIWSPPAKRTWQCAPSRLSHTPGSTERERKASQLFRENHPQQNERELNISSWADIIWELHRNNKKCGLLPSQVCQTLTHCFDNSWRLMSVQTCYKRYWNIQMCILWEKRENASVCVYVCERGRERAACVCMWARVYNNWNR